ncbi:MAG: DUF4342 domain-containing protein [Rhizobiaceae bacterium]
MEARKEAADSTKGTTSPNPSNPKLTWTEEIEVAGEELVASVKRLAAEGQVSRIRLIDSDGDIVLEMPLTIGAIAGGAVVLAAPVLALVGALAVFVTKVKLEVVRNGNPPPDKSKSQ